MIGRIERRGKSSWRLRFDAGPDPVTKKRRQQNVTFRGTKRGAEAKLTEMLAAIGKATYVEATKVTVGDFVRQRVRHWYDAGEITARTVERYDQLVDHQILPHLGGGPLQGLRTIDIEQWHTKLRLQGRKDGSGGLRASSIRAAHRILAKALREGVKHGLLMRNVCGGDDGQRAPKSETSEMEIIPADRITEVIEKLRGLVIFPKVVVGLFTGMRRGEILALRWGNVDLATKVIRVREAVEETRRHGLTIKAPKTGAGIRDIVMPNIVVEALNEVRREQTELRLAMGLGRLTDESLVFSKLDGSCQSPNVFSGDWHEKVLVLKLPDVSLHALRHTHASMLIDSGVDVVRVAKRLGHADPSVTLRTYAHLFRKRDDLSADAINTALSGIGRTS